MSLLHFVKSKSFFKQLIYAIIVLVIVVFVVMKWLKITTNHQQKIEVPDLKKMSLVVVQKTLEEIDLKWIVIDSASYNPNYPKNSVIEHNPEAGDFVKENRKIYLTMNPSGYKDVEIPDLYGKTKRQATSQLKAIGFRISSTNVYVRDIGKDVVRGLLFNGKEIKAGDKIPKDSQLTLKLGDGKGKGSYKRTSVNSN